MNETGREVSVARFLKYVPAGLLCVVTVSSASSAWARRQDGNPPQPAQSPVQPVKPLEKPLDPTLVGQLPTALSQDCFTMVIVPGDPNIDKGIVQKPADQLTQFKTRVVPAPTCVVPGAAKTWGQVEPSITSPPLPTNRTPLPTNRTPYIWTIPVLPLAPTLPSLAPAVPPATGPR